MAEEHFVDKHRIKLTQRVKNIATILDGLLLYNVISQESYDEIMSMPDSEGKMRALFSGPLESTGGKDIFYNVLKENEPYLLDALKRTEYENMMEKVKVETMAVKKLLVEKLSDLSSQKLDEFKSLIELEKGFPLGSKSRLKVANTQDVVELIVETYSQQSVEVTEKVLKKMKRTDLVHRLSIISLTSKEKHRPTLIQRVEKIASVIELLLETLADLNSWEILEVMHDLLCQIHCRRCYSAIPRMTDMEDTVFLMVQVYGQKSLKKIKKVLKKMDRIDLVWRLSVTASQWKKKHSVDKALSALIHKVASMAAVKELLSETLSCLRNKELMKFKWFLQFTYFQKSLPLISWTQLEWADRAEIVDLMMETHGQRSVEVTMEVFMDMNRTDLVKRMSEISSGLKKLSDETFDVKTTEEESCSGLIPKVERMMAIIDLLLETLADLGDSEIEDFKQQIYHLVPYYDWSPLAITDMQDAIFFLVQLYGQESVEKTKEVLEKMKWTDFVKRLSDSSLAPQKKPPVDKHPSALIHKVATMAAVKQLLLETMNDLSDEDVEEFKNVLRLKIFQKDLSGILWMDTTDNKKIAALMLETFGQQSVEVTKKIFMHIKKAVEVEWFSDTSSGPKDKHYVHVQHPARFKSVAATNAVKQILWKAMQHLSHKECIKFMWLLQFMYFQKGLPQIPWDQLKRDETKHGLMNVILERHDQQCLEVTREIFKDMNRTDLIERLSETSSEPKGKRQPEQFLKDIAIIQKGRLDIEYREDIVKMRVERYSQQKKTKPTTDILPEMMDYPVFESLSVISSGSKEKYYRTINEPQPTLIQEVETMAAIKQQILDALNDLNHEEFEKFKDSLQAFPEISVILRYTAEKAEIVNLIVRTYGQWSMEVTKNVLKSMNKPHLLLRLLETSSGPAEKQFVDEHQPALLETRKKVKKGSLAKDIKRTEVVQSSPESSSRLKDDTPTVLDLSAWGGIYIKPSYLKLSHLRMGSWFQMSYNVLIYYKINSASLKLHVYVIPHHHGIQQAVDERESSSGYKIIQKPHPGRSPKIVLDPFAAVLDPIAADPTSRYGRNPQFFEVTIENPDSAFKLTLRNEFNTIWTSVIEKDDYQTTADTHGRRRKRKKKKGKKLEALEGALDPSDWTKLSPEVNSMHAEEAPTYSLQSEAGNFECNVSGLRWVCKDKVNFTYQFCSWDGHMERMENRQYMPAGPLIDITVVAGKLDEVYLPHWICIDDNPAILDKFAVLHIDDCGDFVEEGSEVTSCHVKLSEPIFSPRAVLMKVGFPVKINCNVLIYYKPNTTFLKLHVYLIPCDTALQQAVDKKESSNGYEIIQKPRPDQYLKMQQCFMLTADTVTANILPEKMTLRYDSQDPNFYEVFIRNPDRDFKLTLSYPCTTKGKPMCEPVWTCEIRKDDYSCSSLLEAAGFPSEAASVNALAQENEEHCFPLIQKAGTITPVRERLLELLEKLKQKELEKFKWHLQKIDIGAGLPCIPACQLEKTNILDLVDLIMHTYCEKAVEMTKMLFKKIKRNDLVKILSDTSSVSTASGSSA